jgi:hypothetical protein
MTTSLANRQFLALARGDMTRQEPRNPFRVVIVGKQERYCLYCCNPQTMDVIIGQDQKYAGRGVLIVQMASICRCCGHAVTLPDLMHIKWIGG